MGVVRSSADNLELARARVLGLAQGLAQGLSGVQWRPDVGSRVRGVLGRLEERGVVV